MRVSTEHQAVQLREFCAKQGWQIIYEYCDYESGSKSDRAESKRMFEDASRRRFDLVLFWALDRLSREGVLETLQYLNRLTAYGVSWRHKRPNFSVASPVVDKQLRTGFFTFATRRNRSFVPH